MASTFAIAYCGLFVPKCTEVDTRKRKIGEGEYGFECGDEQGECAG